MNAPIVGEEAAKYAARCVIYGTFVALAALVWMAVFVFAERTNATLLAGGSLLVFVLVALPMSFLSVRCSAIAARLAAEHLSPQLGFRPRWWMCYSSPRGWSNAIERQKRWRAADKWPLIPW